jgi:hypothetical protein
VLVLRTLQWGPQHGHGIGQAIRAQSNDLLRVETSFPSIPRCTASSVMASLHTVRTLESLPPSRLRNWKECNEKIWLYVGAGAWNNEVVSLRRRVYNMVLIN